MINQGMDCDLYDLGSSGSCRIRVKVKREKVFVLVSVIAVRKDDEEGVWTHLATFGTVSHLPVNTFLTLLVFPFSAFTAPINKFSEYSPDKRSKKKRRKRKRTMNG